MDSGTYVVAVLLAFCRRRDHNSVMLKRGGHHGHHVTCAYHDVSLTIEDHQFIGILGPSGSGKSSLLYLLSGLRRPTQGEIYLDGRAYGKMPERERVALRRTEFGFVFQQHFLINYLTALENVMVAAPVQDKAHAEQAKSLLADLGMGDKLHRFPYELSGGERQRIDSLFHCSLIHCSIVH